MDISSLYFSLSLSLCGEVGENINIIDDEPLVSIYGVCKQIRNCKKIFLNGETRKMCTWGGIDSLFNFRQLYRKVLIHAGRWVSIFLSKALLSIIQAFLRIFKRGEKLLIQTKVF